MPFFSNQNYTNGTNRSSFFSRQNWAWTVQTQNSCHFCKIWCHWNISWGCWAAERMKRCILLDSKMTIFCIWILISRRILWIWTRKMRSCFQRIFWKNPEHCRWVNWTPRWPSAFIFKMTICFMSSCRIGNGWRKNIRRFGCFRYRKPRRNGYRNRCCRSKMRIRFSYWVDLNCTLCVI